MRTVTAELRVPLPERPAVGADTSEEELARHVQDQQAVIDAVTPFLSSLPSRPLQRVGNVSEVSLLGGDESGGRWSLLVMLEVDSAVPGLERGLLEVLPEGSEVSILGTFGRVAVWPEPVDS
jgi:hypothetical protein